MARRIILSALIIAMGFLLQSCKTNPFDKSGEKLTEITNSYEATMRWGRIENAYQFLLPELQEQAVIPAGLGNVRVTHYEVVSGPTQVSESRMTQLVLIQYLYRDQQVIKELLDKQVWDRPDGGEDWFRANPVPDM